MSKTKTLVLAVSVLTSLAGIGVSAGTAQAREDLASITAGALNAALDMLLGRNTTEARLREIRATIARTRSTEQHPRRTTIGPASLARSNPWIGWPVSSMT